MADPIIQSLEPYTTCDISDALLKLSQQKNTGFLPNLTMWSPKRQKGTTKIVGPAYTVQYVSLDDPAPKYESHYIDSVHEGAVIFVSSPRGTSNAVYGGLMSTRAKARGAVGVVVDGRFRDLGEQRGLGFPVFARDVGTAPPYGSVKVSAVDVPVTVQDEAAGGEVVINPGDYIVADLNGVVCLPRELAQKVLPLMERQVVADGKIAADIKDGVSFVEASRKHRG
ncbi:ribonuclease E inhibitor RraA/Dimethylmenaquinone methyltransferase [Aspergillus bertholletiae]|uniref:Ribonuclease E inhibitor RraA/Dimethylmenaquinone methyltransferase n=1 Tax=Aspergillus bertholletiae TaxID=1226010 RepID=A0A5N7BN96_9EURO|nr:ribonuclease E inhibitor RraA/Dimethylmenaquinone methyltransferase [Aspergillus bertholletiae]